MSFLPVENLLKPVEGHEDVIQFRQDFVLDAKALEDGTPGQTITVADDGDLIIEGYAAVFDGMDRQNENFVDGAFQEGISKFLGGQAALCYNHKHDKVLGKVIELVEEEGKGLKMKARIDGSIQSHPELGTLYHQIKRGTINALSVGGFFKRALVNGRKMISGVDFTEISATAVPVHPGTNFAVLAGKALMSEVDQPEVPAELVDEEVRDSDVERLSYAVAELQYIYDQLAAARAKRQVPPTN
jgi:HK97 family phage prohead protease